MRRGQREAIVKLKMSIVERFEEGKATVKAAERGDKACGG